jgi:hypothetical protein
MKKNNLLQLLETHVDKIVLGLMSLIGLVLLWMYVIGNPYGAEIDGKKRGPGEIDSYVKTKADRMLQELEKSADPITYDKKYLAEYDQLVQCPISKIASLSIPYPGTGEAIIEEDRMYALPEIAPLTEVAAASLRGAAQMPANEIQPDMGYLSSSYELEDLDLVTVSARFNVQSLYNGLQQSFMGPRLKTSWKESNLAKPVFARLELQRRELLEDGTWGTWQEVPRTQIDTYKKMLEEVPMTTDRLQFGVNILMNQFSDKALQRNILQPQAYTFSISRCEWMPPTYLREALDIIQKQEDLLVRQQREERAKRLETPTTDRRPDAGRPTAPVRQDNRRQTDTARKGRDQMTELGFENPVVAPRTPTRRERTLDDVKADIKKVLLDEKTGPESLREDLLVWAHDDTVKPGKTYQYRLRLGVFNPIAGKEWFRSDQSQYKNQVVLWSAYTPPTSEIFIQKRIHVFPTELIAAKNSVGGTEGVKVEVAKYYLGRWRMQAFDVFPGQIIGKEAEIKTEAVTPAARGLGMGAEMDFMMMNPTAEGSMTEPKTVDFTTPYTMVDINHLITWGSNAQRRSAFDLMLFYDPQSQIKQAAIGKTNWDSSLRKDYQRVEAEMQRATQPQSPGMTPLPGGGRTPMFEERILGGA